MQTPAPHPRRRALLHAAYGVLATVVGLAAGHLVAAFTVPSASPVLAVGSTVIDLTPTPLKEFAIRQFGTADKLVLVGSVLGHIAAPGMTAYIVSKWGIRALARQLVLENRDLAHVHVSCVSPGGVDTPIY